MSKSQLKLNHNSNSSAWMVTFADLISLILVFFVLIYSMSDIEGGRWQKIVESLNKTFHTSRSLGSSQGINQLGVQTAKSARLADLNYLYSILINKRDQDPTLNSVTAIQMTDNKLIISFESEILFDSEDKITGTLEASFAKVIEALEGISNVIEINSWVTFPPMVADSYDIWHISLLRSLNVADLFKVHGRSHNVRIAAGPISGIDVNNIDNTIQNDYLRIVIHESQTTSTKISSL